MGLARREARFGADDRNHAGETSSAALSITGKPCVLKSGKPRSAAMGLYHFMRVKDPFAEEGTKKLEEEVEGFISKLKAR